MFSIILSQNMPYRTLTASLFGILGLVVIALIMSMLKLGKIPFFRLHGGGSVEREKEPKTFYFFLIIFAISAIYLITASIVNLFFS